MSERAPVRREHRCAEGIEGGRAEAADDVRDFDHEAAGSKVGHDAVEETS